MISTTDSLLPFFAVAAMVLAIASMSVQLALAWVERASADEGAERILGRLAAGACLATGMWCLQAVAALLALGGNTFAFLAWQQLAFWLLATLAGAAALSGAVAKQAAAARWVPASLALGTAVVALHVLATQSISPTAIVEWRTVPLLWAWLCGAAGSLLAVGVYRNLRRLSRRAEFRARIGAGLALGSAMLVSEQGVEMAASMGSFGTAAWARIQPGVAPTVLVLLGSAVGLFVLDRLLRARAQVQSARITAQREIHSQYLNDPLTGLPTRGLFDGTLTQAVAHADANRQRLALLFINLDDFRALNQLYGHLDGDRVLRKAASRLRALAKPHMAARMANDEFVLLLRDNPTLEEASSTAASLLAAIARPFKDDSRDLSVTCSIGVVMYPEHGAMSTMIDHAESAMRAAKSAGGACHYVFDARLLKGSNAQMGLLRELRTAISQRQFELYYQAKVHAPTGEITGAEALLRWNHPQRGLVSPTDFIPMAERYGLIAALGAWVIDEACRQAREWRDSGLRMRVAINLSMIQLHQPDLADQIAEALKRHQINPDLITCEITESAAMDDTELTTQVLRRLDQIGVYISIDDFGTGHSSLAHLRKLPADELKIDRSFVQDLESSEDARKVAAAVVNLAKSLNLKVVAEGVETEGQYKILQEFGCDQLQGYLFAKPMSAKALALWAMEDEGPRTMSFRSSLFKPTMAVHSTLQQ